MMKIRIISFIFVIFYAAGLEAQDPTIHFTSLSLKDGKVTADLIIEGLVGEDLVSGLSKGMTASLEYQLQVWQKRRFWSDKPITEHYRRIKISFDPWLKKYIFESGGTKEEMVLDSLVNRLTKLNHVEGCTVDLLGEKRPCYFTLTVTLHPLAMENVGELSRWLSGEVKDLRPGSFKSVEEPDRKAGSWLLKVFLSVSGLGGKVTSGKSPSFQVEGQRLSVQGY